MKKIVRVLTISAIAALATACTTGTQSPAPVVDGNAARVHPSLGHSSSQGLGQQSGLNGANVTAQGDTNVIYFDLNRSKVLSQYSGIVDQFANYLVKHPDTKIKIAGYTDKSGSRAWNLSLSQYRAKSVAKALESRGVKAKQIQIVGFGEEYSTSGCANKAVCWKDRRAEINPVG